MRSSPLHPRGHRPGWIAALQYWLAAAVCIVWALVLLAARARVPRAAPASVSATSFSADRAWPVLAYLADTIRYRVAGTPGADSAAAYLARTLRRVPGVDVEIQDVSGAWTPSGSGVVLAYTVRNVLVRIPGARRDAVLLSAHYDSPPGSVGAADDGVAVAALVEVVRALAAGPRLPSSVIVNLNDGEEQGLVGSAGFTQHPWMRDVRAFVNLESAGPHGKATLFQAGPGNPWLTKAYAHAAAYPWGTVLGQDIFQSGVIPSDTDFRIYRDLAGLRGLDIALYQGGWAYHTQRDRTWNVSRGTMQQVGANALALARALARGPLPGNVSRERGVYYDVLGAVMLSYTARRAQLLAALAIIAGLAALAVAARRRRVRWTDLALALACMIGTVVVALVAALALAGVAAYVVRRPMSWFARPGPAIASFALGAVAATLLVHRPLAARFGRRPATGAHGGALAVQGGALLFWMLVLLALTAAGVGSAYLALWWVGGSAAGLAYNAFAPDRRWWIGVLLGAIPGGVLTLQLLVMLTELFVPVFGRLPLPIAPDPVLAVIVALPASAIALALLPGAHRTGHLGAAALATGAIAVLMLIVSLVEPRYTFRRPQRLTIIHEQDGSRSVLRVLGADYDTPRLALARASGFRPAPGAGARPLEFDRAAPATGFPSPTLALLETRPTAAPSMHTLTFRASAPEAYHLRLALPADRIAGWSLPTALPVARHGTIRVEYVAPPDTGWRFSLDVRGDAPLSVHLDATRFHTTHDAAALMHDLPTWTDVHALVVNGADWTF